MFYLTKETVSFFIDIHFSDLDFLLFKKIRLVNTTLRRSFVFPASFRTWQFIRKRKIIQTELINCRWCIQKKIYEDCDLNYFDSNLILRPRSSVWPPGGGTPYNGLQGEGPPDRGTFWRPQVYERGVILPVEASVWKGSEICHFGLEKGPKGLIHAFYGCEKIEKTFWFCDLSMF